MQCESCGYEFNYNDPSATRSFYVIEERNEVLHGRQGMIAFCKDGCAPFGNTKIPDQIND